MYCTKERDGKSLFFQSEKDKTGEWSEDRPINSLNQYIEGYRVKTPFISYDGTTMYFSANIPGSEGFDIYSSKKAGDEWQKPVKVPVINSPDDEISPSLSANNMSMFFTRQSLGRETGCRTIYHTERDASANWIYPMPMPLPVGLACESTPAVSPNGETLFFVSDRISEKRRRRFNVCLTRMIHENLWSYPTPVDSVAKEFSEYSPAVDYEAGVLHVVRLETGRDKPTSKLYSSPLPTKLVNQNLALIEGQITDSDKKPVVAKITLRDAYSLALVATHENDGSTGEYRITPERGRLYVMEVSNDKSASVYHYLSTIDEAEYQGVRRDFVLFDKVRLELEVYDDFTGKEIDASLSFYPQGNKIVNEKLGKGKYLCYMPLNRQIDIDVSRVSYASENISIKIPYEQQFAELRQVIRLKPGLRRGELKVEDVITNKPMSAEVKVKNLDRDDEPVRVEASQAGGYSFSLRKSDRYTLSVMRRGYMYFHAIWRPDASGVRHSLNIRLVPLQQTDRIAMQTLSFDSDTTELSAEWLSELECVASVIRNNPNAVAQISIPVENSKASERIVQKAIRMIGAGLASRMVSQSRYLISTETKTSSDSAGITPLIQFVERNR
jgi:hypothetical protein